MGCFRNDSDVNDTGKSSSSCHGNKIDEDIQRLETILQKTPLTSKPRFLSFAVDENDVLDPDRDQLNAINDKCTNDLHASDNYVSS